MRLLNSRLRQLELYHSRSPAYAIVSHRWGSESEEVLFDDIGDEAWTRSKRNGYAKIEGACTQATQDELNYVWLDTCCIDKSNGAELSEAINSMYKWYRNSDVCYAHLRDVGDLSEFTKSDWFSRGWTLQELIAPKKLKFFTKDWRFLGTREDLIGPISETTGICYKVLQSANILREATISQKMCWAAKRQTTLVEDVAYSLLGLFRVNMLPIYGIDNIAFEELQHKLIVKYSDQTLFSWYRSYYAQSGDTRMDVDLDSVPVDNNTDIHPFAVTGLLAYSPSQYLKSYEISDEDFCKNFVDKIRDLSYQPHVSSFNNLIRILLPVKHVTGKIWKAILRCSFEPPDGDRMQRPLVIYLKELDELKFVRVHLVPGEGQAEKRTLVQIRDRGVSGSLERLGDAELQLMGYILREIDIIARYEPSFPHCDSKFIEDESIARLPRHPPGIETNFDIEEEGNGPQKPGMTQMGESRGMEREGEARMVRTTASNYLESEMGKLLNDWSNSPRDLTGRVTRSDQYPFASGSHGDIYRGNVNIRGTSTKVAIKMCRIASLGPGDDHLNMNLKRFRREITLWLRLSHPNVLPLLGTFRDPTLHPEIPAMVCPWVENGDLSKYLERDELPLSRRLDLVNGVARGLHYLHSQHVVHGDLSGSNVLVKADGSACIGDFGLSTLLTGTSDLTFTMNSRHILGSLRWMAPELLDLNGSQRPTAQSDVYSFGSIVLQILSGRIPYHYFTRDAQVVMAVAMGTRPKRPNQTEVTDKIWGFIEWCWSSGSRPSSDQIVMLTEKESAEVMVLESGWKKN